MMSAAFVPQCELCLCLRDLLGREVNPRQFAAQVEFQDETSPRPLVIPDAYICPILQECMRDPVKTCDGFIYDRTSIEPWFATCEETHMGRITSPMTNLLLPSTVLSSQRGLRAEIAGFINDNHV